MRLIGGVDPHRMGVPTHVRRRLKQRDLMALVQQMGDGETGDAGPDDGDPHSNPYVA